LYSPIHCFPYVPINFNPKILILVGFVGIALTAAFLPGRVSAFWPFSTNANADAEAVVPTSSTPALQAATNVNPNPSNGLGDIVQTSGNAMLAYTGPSGTTADIASAPPPDRISVYVVRQGDTLSEIAGMFNVSVNTIVWANSLGNVRDVHPGDTLIILPVSGTQHTVVKGDTLKSIAKKYGADANEIAEYNGLDSSLPLSVGSSVIIPGGEISAPTSSSSSSGSSRIMSEPYLGGSGSAQSGYYSNPLPGAILTQSIHGWNAVDLGAARGTPIHAAADGTVIIARNNGGWNGGYGNYVVITHDNGTQTLYAHMSHAIVSAGEPVSSGQTIGYVGMTGLTTGPHLHFEVRGAANPFRNCPVGAVCEPQ
jgi:murein DD-endopeptidase MepM/ murein hydrolase activator NlpD